MSIALRTSIAILFTCAVVLVPKPAAADEGGVSFWVPGFFGSLAATPQQPGWSFATIYYHTSVKAGADVAFARQVGRGNINVNFNGNLNINLKADADLQFLHPELHVRNAGAGRAGGLLAVGGVRPQRDVRRVEH